MALEPSTLSSLAETYGTPLYVYDAARLRQQYTALHRYFTWPNFRVLYAMKANYNAAILALLRDLGAWLDTVSPAEVILAQRLGYTADRMLYTANNMTNDEVTHVHETGILLNIGSLSRLDRYGRQFPGSRVCLRFNPDVVAGAHAKIRTGGDLTKFGILMDDADQVVDIARRHRLRIVGLHEHTGSGIAETQAFYDSIDNLLALASPERFPDLEFIDFGGGFKVPYHPDEAPVDYKKMGARISDRFADFCDQYGRKLALYIEPGKFMVAECGYMLVTVNTLKINRTRKIAGVDSGFPQLIRPMFYDAYHHIANLSNPDGMADCYDICGNICETGDRFAEQRMLPEVREGDILAIENAGAYCYTMGGVYNLRAMPAEVLVDSDNGRHELVRRRLSNEELIDQILGESTL